MIEGKIIDEVKAMASLTSNDETQMLNYLKGTGLRLGLLINFGTPSLEWKRMIL